MALKRLGVRDFRCFYHADLNLSPHDNFIFGANAAGKTSLLEAIFVLSRGRSFRTAQTNVLIRDGQISFQVFGEVDGIPLGIERNADGLKARLGGSTPSSRAVLAETLPVQMIDAGVHFLIEGSPKYRRRFLDWGAFHVEHSFWPAWRRYQRGLRQRNALLRTGADTRTLQSWTNEVVESGMALESARKSYFELWLPVAMRFAAEILQEPSLEFAYRHGWSQQQSLEEALINSVVRDQKTGTTNVGPHRSQFTVRYKDLAACERISRGQQKALAAALVLAQAVIFTRMRGKACTLLIDDAPAEFDEQHLERFFGLLEQTGAQTVLTAIDSSAFSKLNDRNAVRFHVEQERVTEML